MSWCPYGFEHVTLAQHDDDANFVYVIENNRRNVNYTDAFCGRDTVIRVNRGALYTISTVDTPFTLRHFAFEFEGASTVTVKLTTDSGQTVTYRVCISDYKPVFTLDIFNGRRCDINKYFTDFVSGIKMLRNCKCLV